jgi:hypothetical protein
VGGREFESPAHVVVSQGVGPAAVVVVRVWVELPVSGRGSVDTSILSSPPGQTMGEAGLLGRSALGSSTEATSWRGGDGGARTGASLLMMGVARGIGVWVGASMGGGADMATDVSIGVSLV